MPSLTGQLMRGEILVEAIVRFVIGGVVVHDKYRHPKSSLDARISECILLIQALPICEQLCEDPQTRGIQEDQAS